MIITFVVNMSCFMNQTSWILFFKHLSRLSTSLVFHTNHTNNGKIAYSKFYKYDCAFFISKQKISVKSDKSASMFFVSQTQKFIFFVSQTLNTDKSASMLHKILMCRWMAEPWSQTLILAYYTFK